VRKLLWIVLGGVVASCSPSPRALDIKSRHGPDWYEQADGEALRCYCVRDYEKESEDSEYFDLYTVKTKSSY
jgi:hypothetical protein